MAACCWSATRLVLRGPSLTGPLPGAQRRQLSPSTNTLQQESQIMRFLYSLGFSEVGSRAMVFVSVVAGLTNGAVTTRVRVTSGKSTGDELRRHKNRSMTVSKRVFGNPIIRIVSDLPQAFLIHSIHTPQGHDGFFAGSGSLRVRGAYIVPIAQISKRARLGRSARAAAIAARSAQSDPV
jgi:hypothetical protein